MADRERQRRGTHTSIAGDAAEEVIRTLVDQFSDPYAFVRELIQNSLDAGASRIEVRMSFEGRHLDIAVVDDGEGMDRATIEGYLLVKFRSTKDKDLTKIGKFGIGFVSLFAMRPVEVVVDTGRDAVWHQVRFDETMAWTLLAMPDPYEGTSVRIRVKTSAKQAAGIVGRIHESAVRWCRFADADITTAVEGLPDGWEARSIRSPFDLELPMTVREEADGFVAVIAPHPGDEPPIGFYNRGLTLWEADEPIIPGVAFRVAGRHLEHTLTRDNVIRDRHFEDVLSRLNTLASGRLGEIVHAAIVAANTDPAACKALFERFGARVPWTWDDSAPMFPAIGRGPASIRELRPSIVGRVVGPAPLFCCDDVPVARRLAASGALVLHGAPGDAHVAFVARRTEREVVDVRTAYRCAEPIVATATDRALIEAISQLTGRRIFLGRVEGDAFAIHQHRAFEAEPVDTEGKEIVINVGHPLYRKLWALPTNVAAPIAAHAIGLSRGERPNPGALVGVLLDATDPTELVR